MGRETYLIDGIHPPIAMVPPSLRVRTRHRARDMLGRDADEVLPRLASDEVVVLFEGDEKDVNVEGGEVDLVDVEGRDVLGERGALRRGEGVWVCVDSPERHGCYGDGFRVASVGFAVRRLIESRCERDDILDAYVGRRGNLYTGLLGSMNNHPLLSVCNIFSQHHISVSISLLTGRPIRKFRRCRI
jgi:hypothetical protein